MSTPSEKLINYSLGILLAFLALNAFGGAYYGMSGAIDVPLEWLEGGPFKNYFIPCLFLFIIIGGAALLASILVFKRHPKARLGSMATAIIVLLWLAIQVIIIGYISWMQPATTILALLILIMAVLRPKEKAVVVRNNNFL